MIEMCMEYKHEKVMNFTNLAGDLVGVASCLTALPMFWRGLPRPMAWGD